MTRQELQTLGSVLSAFQTLRQVVILTCPDRDEQEGVLENVRAVEVDIVDILQGKLQVKGYMVVRPNPASL